MSSMKDLVDLFKELSASITDRKTREKLGPIQDKIMEVQNVQLELQQRNMELQQKTTDLAEKHTKEKANFEARIAELEKQQLAGDFVTHNGLPWKKKQSGGFEAAPYCPKCKLAMLDLETSWGCTACEYRAEHSDPPPKTPAEIPIVGRHNARRSL